MFSKNIIFHLILIAVLMTIMVFAGGCSKESTTEPDETHFEAVGLKLRQDGVEIVTVQNGAVSGAIEAVEGAATTEITVIFIDEDGHEGQPEGAEYALSVSIADGAVASLEQHAGEDWSFHIRGEAVGQTEITIGLLHGDHADFESAPIGISVIAPGTVNP